jgi:hypothetical protein
MVKEFAFVKFWQDYEFDGPKATLSPKAKKRIIVLPMMRFPRKPGTFSGSLDNFHPMFIKAGTPTDNTGSDDSAPAGR